MCKKKTNRAKRTFAQIKTCANEVRDFIRNADADNLKIRKKIGVIKEELGLS